MLKLVCEMKGGSELLLFILLILQNKTKLLKNKTEKKLNFCEKEQNKKKIRLMKNKAKHFFAINHCFKKKFPTKLHKRFGNTNFAKINNTTFVKQNF